MIGQLLLHLARRRTRVLGEDLGDLIVKAGSSSFPICSKPISPPPPTMITTSNQEITGLFTEYSPTLMPTAPRHYACQSGGIARPRYRLFSFRHARDFHALGQIGRTHGDNFSPGQAVDYLDHTAGHAA